MISFKDYIWARIRKPMWTSWLALVLLSVFAYSVVIMFLKATQLDSSLRVAIYTVHQSIQAGDWSLALGHLQAIEKAGPVFDITLRPFNGSQNVSGPFGEHPFGLGTFCSEQSTEQLWVLHGCMRIFGWTELYTLGLFILFAFSVFGISFRLFRSKSLFFIGKISEELEEMQRESPAGQSDQPIAEISAIRQHIHCLRSQTEQASRTKAFTELSVQVAHDIRSPLAALDMVVKDSSVLPESDRVLVRTAVSRITDIANNLITQYSLVPKDLQSSHFTKTSAQTNLLSTLIESVVSEKRMQYRARLGIEICAKSDANTYGLFVNVDAVEFKRALSNLINNSFEAIEASGHIDVTTRSLGGVVEIVILDTGKGIPPELLPKVMNRGASFGKVNGTGLGLFHAKESIESWGGTITLQSQESSGTRVIIELPRAESPEWFVRELVLEVGSTIVVLDDDPSIHQVWDGRFHGFSALLGAKVLHFSTTSQFAEWHHAADPAKQVLYLMDYELLGSESTGLDLIEELGIAKNSILVTSRYEEQSVRERCHQLHVALIPKSMAGFVPISVEATQAVLIDDDPIIHQLWERSAQNAGKSLFGFTSVDTFLRACTKFDPNTPIYLDSDLGNGLRGEVLASQIHARGFSTIYLVTGFSKKDFAPRPEIRGVLNKTPPWQKEI